MPNAALPSVCGGLEDEEGVFAHNSPIYLGQGHLARRRIGKSIKNERDVISLRLRELLRSEICLIESGRWRTRRLRRFLFLLFLFFDRLIIPRTFLLDVWILRFLRLPFGIFSLFSLDFRRRLLGMLSRSSNLVLCRGRPGALGD